MKSRLSIIIPILLAVVAAGVIAYVVFDDDEPAATPGTFANESYPFAFEYPPEWSLNEDPSFAFGSGSATSSVAVQLAAPENQVVISEYTLTRTLGPDENAPKDEIQGVVDELEDQTDGRAGRLKAVRFGGAPGYEYNLRFRVGDSQRLVSRIVYLFKGQRQIEVNCQSNRDGRAQIDAGCEEVLDTLSISNSP